MTFNYGVQSVYFPLSRETLRSWDIGITDNRYLFISKISPESYISFSLLLEIPYDNSE